MEAGSGGIGAAVGDAVERAAVGGAAVDGDECGGGCADGWELLTRHGTVSVPLRLGWRVGSRLSGARLVIRGRMADGDAGHVAAESRPEC